MLDTSGVITTNNIFNLCLQVHRVHCKKGVFRVKKAIDIQYNGAWVLQSVLLRELFPLLKQTATPEERYENKLIREEYRRVLDNFSYEDLLIEFQKRLGSRYELTNLNDEQVKLLENK